MGYKQSIVRGAIFIIAAELMLTINGAIIKLASDGLPNEMIVCFRNVFGLLSLMPIFAREGTAIIQTQKLHLHLVRGICGVTAMYSLFFVLGNLELANAMLLKATIPIFIPLVAFSWLKESISVIARLAIAVGFCGVFLILKPGTDFNWVMLVGLFSSAFASVSMVTIRKLSATEPAVRTVLYFAIIASLVSVVPLTWAWKTPTTNEWLLLISVGICSTLVQLLTTRGYASAPASQVGVFSYSSVVFGALVGWLFWNELWDANSFVGAIFITAAGFLALRSREKAVSVNE
ncbi:putative permease [Rivularia sp. PCC 7116]|uniref:DMT family transporter n=1 Tax=Rivularia sp. PCC 7116 TaxID=373994 RepID=UPI00029EDF61|nr:DMT family transporter [Rivularia sp. PCC 7116]AFY56095.1 putative permease [Rivularia sp. PCC 7116]